MSMSSDMRQVLSAYQTFGHTRNIGWAVRSGAFCSACVIRPGRPHNIPIWELPGRSFHCVRVLLQSMFTAFAFRGAGRGTQNEGVFPVGGASSA
eukprot:9160046-Alexandrium_andersonii.AAC.1